MDSNRLEQIQKIFNQLSYKIKGLTEQEDALIDIDLALEKNRVLYDLLSELKLEKLSQKDDPTPQKTIQRSPKIQVIEEQISNDIDDEALKLIEEKEHLDFLTTENEKINSTEENPIAEKAASIVTEPEVEFIDEPIEEEKEEVIVIVKEEPVELKVEKVVEKPIAKPEPVKTKKKKATKKKAEPKVEVPVQAKVQKEVPVSNHNMIETNDTVADQFEVKTSLNDILSEINSNDDFATQLRMRPIPDLRNAISLNDKIWFTRELFDGNNDKFKSSLESINNSNTMQEAIEVADTFGWDKKESSTKKFLELIYRRFI